ncbi:MAG TPA: DUF1131 family protein [Vampirovibrionales bacterium]
MAGEGCCRPNLCGGSFCCSEYTGDGKLIERPRGATIGMSYNQTPGFSRFECFPGEGPTTNYLICSSPQSDRVQYIYGPIARENWGSVPPETVLGNLTLDRLVWLNWQGE